MQIREDWGEGDETQDEIVAEGLGDGLPVVVPTRERIERMLAACAQRSAAIAVLPPGYEDVTWRDVAVNAVMAGCKPAYLPIVAAAVEAIAAPEFNLLGIATTTGSATMCI